jgi:hypothetical protein
MFAASALAANTVCRSACGAAAPLFTQYMFDALGVGGGGSLIGGMATLLAPIPFIFYKYGGPIRERSKFAPTQEKGPGEQDEGSREEDMRVESDSSQSSSAAEIEGANVEEDIERDAKRDDLGEEDTEQLGWARTRANDPEKDLEKGE